MSRAPSTPPLLDGYEYIGVLGTGGFADVFQYRQLRPRREVAVKVMLRGLGADTQRQFEDEANVMAMLSSHPSIVSIHSAGVAPDGRPYLVMESCHPRHLGTRLRNHALPLGRALEVAVQIAGTVESAHRLGVLHRDIKPANILFTDFGRPALTDFGISAAEGGQGAAAFSVAWAPPEQIGNQPMGVEGDVYSLAATLHAMLTGHSPFDVPGENNSMALAHRVKTMPPPPTGRSDVPESLELVLRTALAKRPEQRYPSALEFARALQRVQAEMHESITTIDVREDRHDDELTHYAETGTRVTGFSMIDPEVLPDTNDGWFDVSGTQGTRQTDLRPEDTFDRSGTGPTGHTAPPEATGGPVLMHGRGSREAHAPLDFTGPSIPQVAGEDTFRVEPGAQPSAAAPAEPEPRRLQPLIVGGIAVVVVVVLAVAWILTGGGGATVAPTATPTATQGRQPFAAVAPPAELAGQIQGDRVVFTWTNSDPEPGDTYLYRLVLLDRDADVQATTEPTASLPVQPQSTCIEVEIRRSTGQTSPPAKKCVP